MEECGMDSQKNFETIFEKIETTGKAWQECSSNDGGECLHELLDAFDDFFDFLGSVDEELKKQAKAEFIQRFADLFIAALRAGLQRPKAA